MSVSWLNEQVSISGALRPRSGRPERRRGAALAPGAAPPPRGGNKHAVARPRQSVSVDTFGNKRRRGGDLGGQVKMAQNALDHQRFFDQRDQPEAPAILRPCSGWP